MRLWFEGGRIRPFTGRPEHLRYNEEAGAPSAPFQLPADGFITGCGLLIRSELLKRLGGFDEALWSYAEDSDLCLRLMEEGWACGVVPAAAMSHKVSATFRLGSPQSMYCITRNSYLLLQRHRLGLGPLTRMAFAGISLGRAGRALALGQPQAAGAILRGLADGLSGKSGAPV
jgi:GT2 family glycosyltransferase